MAHGFSAIPYWIHFRLIQQEELMDIHENWLSIDAIEILESSFTLIEY